MDPARLETRQLTLDGALFALFLVCYVLTSSGRICGGDSGTMYQVTRNMAARGAVTVVAETVTIPAQHQPGFLPARPYEVETAFVSPGVAGLTYSPYGWGQSLAALPLYALSRLGDGLWVGVGDDLMARMLAQFLNAFFLAATTALLVRFGRSLGFGPRVALLVGFAFAFGTMVWPYVKTFYSEPATAFCLLAVVYCVFQLDRTDDHWWAFGAGLALGAGLVFRITSAIAGPAVAVYLGVILWRRWRDTRRWDITAIGLIGLGCLPGAAIVLAYNQLRFGQLVALGYTGAQIGWTTPVIDGLYGLLFSPGKGLFVYNPVLLLAVGGMLLLWVRYRDLALLIGMLGVSYVLFHAPYTFWTGGWNWGPRFLIPIVPLLMLPVGLLLQELRGKVAWLIAGGLIVLSVAIQVPAVLVDHSRDMIALSEQYEQFYGKTVDEPAFSPAVRQWPVALEVLQRFSNRQTRVDVQAMLGGDRATWSQRDAHGADLTAELTAEGEFIRNNVPDFWWVYLYLLRVPWGIITAALAGLVACGGLAAGSVCRQVRAAPPICIE